MLQSSGPPLDPGALPPPTVLSLQRFSSADRLLNGKPVWTHLAGQGSLYVMFDSITCHAADGHATRRRVFKVLQGNKIVEHVYIDHLLHLAASDNHAIGHRQAAESRQLIVILAKRPCLAIRFLQEDHQMRRIQLNFSPAEGYDTACNVLTSFGLSLQEPKQPAIQATKLQVQSQHSNDHINPHVSPAGYLSQPHTATNPFPATRSVEPRAQPNHPFSVPQPMNESARCLPPLLNWPHMAQARSTYELPVAGWSRSSTLPSNRLDPLPTFDDRPSSHPVNYARSISQTTCPDPALACQVPSAATPPSSQPPPPTLSVSGLPWNTLHRSYLPQVSQVVPPAPQLLPGLACQTQAPAHGTALNAVASSVEAVNLPGSSLPMMREPQFDSIRASSDDQMSARERRPATAPNRSISANDDLITMLPPKRTLPFTSSQKAKKMRTEKVQSDGLQSGVLEEEQLEIAQAEKKQSKRPVDSARVTQQLTGGRKNMQPAKSKKIGEEAGVPANRPTEPVPKAVAGEDVVPKSPPNPHESLDQKPTISRDLNSASRPEHFLTQIQEDTSAAAGRSSRQNLTGGTSAVLSNIQSLYQSVGTQASLITVRTSRKSDRATQTTQTSNAAKQTLLDAADDLQLGRQLMLMTEIAETVESLTRKRKDTVSNPATRSQTRKTNAGELESLLQEPKDVRKQALQEMICQTISEPDFADLCEDIEEVCKEMAIVL